MIKIHRHPFTESKLGKEEMIKIHFRRKETALERLAAGKKVVFYYLKDNFLGIIRTRYMNGIKQNPKPEYMDYLDSGIAHFEQVQEKVEKVEISVFNRKFTVDAIEKDHGADFYTAYQLYNIAKVVRSPSHLEKIINFGLPFSDQIQNPYWSKVFEYLKYSTSNQAEKRQKIFRQIQAIAETDITTFIGLESTEIIQEAGTSNIWLIYHFPIINLYEKIYQNKEAEFNALLEAYLNNKKQDIIKNDKNDNPNYWVDFDLLGVLATAEDQQIKIQIETDYAPKELYSKIYL